MIESYDRQIQFLMNRDFDSFLEEIDENIDMDTHKDAWDETGYVVGSLFEFLPGITLCVSQIEHETNLDDEEEYWQDKSLANSVINLPDMGWGGKDVNTEWFTEAELQEFKRRQLAARE